MAAKLLKLLIGFAVLMAALAAASWWLLGSEAVRRALEAQAAAWLRQPVQIREASPQLFPRLGVSLRGVTIGSPARITLERVDVSTGLAALLSRRVEDGQVLVAGSRIELPLPFDIPTGPTAPAEAAPTNGSGLTIASIRSIALSDVHIVSRGRELAISAESSLEGTRLELTGFHANTGRSAIEASGTIELGPVVNADVTARADRLDVDDLVALAAAFAPGASSDGRASRRFEGPVLSVVEGRIRARISAPQGTAAGVSFRDFSAEVTAHENRVALAPVSLALFGGRYSGSLGFQTSGALTATVSAQLSDLDVSQLSAFAGSPGAATGRLTSSGEFFGRGKDVASVLSAARGHGRLEIVKGTLKGLEIVRAVIRFLDPQSRELPQARGERFERLTATVSLANQIARSEDITMIAGEFDVAARGTLSLPGHVLDLRADLLLSPELSERAGRDLHRYTREGDRIVLPATITGTIEQPRVTIDAAAAVKRGLRNEIERRLKSLFDRLKRPS
jgi:uncharacterized protein involved in outer membrane biogenesis